MYQNHVIDPTFFYDAIEEFSFNYDIYVIVKNGLNEAGKTAITFDKQIIRGSLQSQGEVLVQSETGNMITMRYAFYCKSLYRINIGDVIVYKNRYLLCKEVRDYDEYGVRSASLEQIQLSSYRDLRDYIRYLNGEELV